MWYMGKRNTSAQRAIKNGSAVCCSWSKSFHVRLSRRCCRCPRAKCATCLEERCDMARGEMRPREHVCDHAAQKETLPLRTGAQRSCDCVTDSVPLPWAKQEVHSCIEVSQLLLSSVERSACCTKSNAAGRKHIAPHMSNQAWRRLKASKPGMNQDLNEIQCLEFEHDSKHDLSWRCVAFAAGDVANRTTKLQRKLCKLRADVHAISPVGLSLKSKNTKRHAKT